ncbi:Dehydrogenases with different specificities (related to short-chain alcohol dehydrogenases) [Klebsiella pneumoniae]|nr:Dehydrogenases with different specificities (related to short-chain alcohol dehydrogenases) [Klebsiella pneumoniae]
MSVMVITGGTAGAGKATALRFARAGYHVALIARDETGLQETRQACERFGVKTLAISADVVDAGALQRAAAEVETTLGAIDVWINNAMTTVLAPFRQMSEEEFRRVTEVTYLGYVNGTRAALEVMTPGIGGSLFRPARRWPGVQSHCSRLTAERKRRSAALPMPCEPN